MYNWITFIIYWQSIRIRFKTTTRKRINYLKRIIMKYKITSWLFSYFIIILIGMFLINCFELFVVFSETVDPSEYNLFINQVLVQGNAVTFFQKILIIIYS